jgi:micrococcal nuclease
VLFGSRQRPTIGALVVLVIGVALFVLTDPGSDGDDSESATERAKRATARVLSITDGDTIHVALDGEDETVRYIGIDTPESAIPGEQPECFGERAARANAGLVEGETVTLVIGAEERDQYGRLLAYVYLGDVFVNAELLRLGLARTLAIAPNTRFAERFDALEQEAANSGRGLWAAC